MSGIITKKDIRHWQKPENRFIYFFNLLFTGADSHVFEKRTKTNKKIRERELKKIFKKALEGDHHANQ